MATNKLPENFPITICHEVNGRVLSTSYVPPLYSSAKLRMVIAAARNNTTQGAKEKKLSRDAYPYSRILFLKTNNTSPFTNKKTIMAIYPVRLLKNWLSSFLQIDHMQNVKICKYAFPPKDPKPVEEKLSFIKDCKDSFP